MRGWCLVVVKILIQSYLVFLVKEKKIAKDCKFFSLIDNYQPLSLINNKLRLKKHKKFLIKCKLMKVIKQKLRQHYNPFNELCKFEQ
jgi:hypothetical protein